MPIASSYSASLPGSLTVGLVLVVRGYVPLALCSGRNRHSKAINPRRREQAGVLLCKQPAGRRADPCKGD